MNLDDNKAYPLIIYTDGAYRGSINVGGWGYVIYHYGGVPMAIGYGGAYGTTNNRMELIAAIEGIKACSEYEKISSIILFTDSLYLQKGMTLWLTKWKKKNYKSVKNSDLWKILAELAGQHRITWKWVKGHSGVEGNEFADELANEGLDNYLLGKLENVVPTSEL